MTCAPLQSPPPLRRRRLALAGFTLVEIMIVVTLVGLLAALALPSYRRINSSAQDRAVLNNARQLASAANQYFAASGATVVTMDDLVNRHGYLRSLSPVAAETYPETFRPDMPIVITGIGGARTITYDY